jgi:Type IV secretion-system coupling protein DNA-binding domain
VARRDNAAPWGAFPIRFPIGKALAIAGTLVLIPVWWSVNDWVGRTELQQRYAWTYLRVRAEAIGHSASSGNFGTRQPYLLLVEGPASDLALVDDAELKVRPAAAHEAKVLVQPMLLRDWMKKTVFPHGWMWQFSWFGGLTFLSGFVFVGAGVRWDYARRRKAQLGVHLTGSREVTVKEFNDAQPSAGGIKIQVGSRPKDQVHIAEELLPYHMALFGSSGMGKSSILLDLVRQIRERGEAAIIYDPKGEFRDRFYNEATDMILDPTEGRCVYWELESEARDEAEATPWGMAFYPNKPNSQAFFLEHPRLILGYMVSRYSAWNEKDIAQQATTANLGLWFARGEEYILPRVRGTEHERTLNRGKKNEATVISDQSQGMYSKLGEIAKPLRMFPPTKEGRKVFSVREFAEKRPGFLFLTSTPMTIDAVRPIHAAIIDMLILATQAASKSEKPSKKLWFILDEVASLKTLPQLPEAIAKQRASGTTMVLGFHDNAQAVEYYGKLATTIMQAYTNIVLGIGESEGAKYVADVLGQEEVDRIGINEPAHSIGKHNRATSYSSNGGQWMPVIHWSIIHNLPRFHGFVVQKGKVVRLAVQKPNLSRITERIERIIPPLIYREQATPSKDKEKPRSHAPVDDVILPTGRAVIAMKKTWDETAKKTRASRKNK